MYIYNIHTQLQLHNIQLHNIQLHNIQLHNILTYYTINNHIIGYNRILTTLTTNRIL
jgi:hypothetical protein